MTTPDYLRKRHMSEGSGRRTLRKIAHELAGCTDEQLDLRNSRVWTAVLHTCLELVNLPVDRVYNSYDRGPTGRAHTAAKAAAIQVCLREYGIPVSRIAEIAGSSRQDISRHSQSTRPAVLELLARWPDSAGPARAALQDTATIEVSCEAAQALLRAAEQLGTLPTALATAAILAACAASQSVPASQPSRPLRGTSEIGASW